MVTIRYVSATGAETVVDASEGDTLMQAALMNNIDGIVGECGGSCMCATCHCFISGEFAEKLPPVSEVEAELLDCAATARQATSRLACQLKVTTDLEGITVNLPELQ
jgi:2Fe-2S ferredoxin